MLSELLDRLAASWRDGVTVSGAELSCWPEDQQSAIRAAGILVPGEPATSVVCDGCERACVMPVHIRSAPSRQAGAFVVCDKRNDINRVDVTVADLNRWRMTAQSLADGLGRMLNSRPISVRSGAEEGFRLGFVQGKTSRAAAQLRRGTAGLQLVVAGHAHALHDLLSVRDGVVALDVSRLRRLVDAPVANAAGASVESTEERGWRLLERKRQLKSAANPRFLKVIAEEEGISVSRVKQLIRKAEAPNPFRGLGEPGARRSVSPARKRER